MADTNTFTTYVLPIAGTALGVVGFCYGAWKDVQLRRLMRRGKAPHFSFDHLLIEHRGASGSPGSYVYTVPLMPTPIDGHLEALFDQPKKLPPDYPNGRLVGVALKNVGSKLRIFHGPSTESFLFCALEPDFFEFRYKHDAKRPYRELVFDLRFETEDGFQGSQRWKIETGSFEVTRLKPRFKQPSRSGTSGR